MKAGHQFVFRLGQIEGQAVRFCNSGNHEHHKAKELRDDKPAVLFLVGHDVHQAERTRQHHHAHQRKPHKNLIAHHLGGGAQPAKQGVFVVGCQSAPQHAVHRQ